MDKRQEIREEISHRLSDFFYRRADFERPRTKRQFDDEIGKFQYSEAGKLLDYLHSQGAFIRYERWIGQDDHGHNFYETAVEPLIDTL